MEEKEYIYKNNLTTNNVNERYNEGFVKNDGIQEDTIDNSGYKPYVLQDGINYETCFGPGTIALGDFYFPQNIGMLVSFFIKSSLRKVY